MSERRYSDEDVHRILADAVEVDAAGLGAERGLTLAQIQSIAAEAGLSPASVVAALAHEVAAFGRYLDRPSELSVLAPAWPIDSR